MRFILHLNNSCYSVPGKNNITPDNPIIPDEPIIPDGPDDNNYAWVDLGLPSGTLWADRNVGATAPEDRGAYFSWGNVIGHKSTNGSTFDDSYNFGSDNTGPYASTPGAALTEDIPANTTYDAAQANMDGAWRMPSQSEFQELYEECTWTWITRNGVNGYAVEGTNGNSIFLPAAGYSDGSSLDGFGGEGSYWSSEFDSDDYECRLYFDDGSVSPEGSDYRCCGFSVRAVQSSPTPVHRAIDLGLPSGKLWADKNLGASVPEDCGDYFAWGETTGYADATARNAALGGSDGFGSSNYANGGAANISEDLSGDTDAATVNWGEDWRTPTVEEIQELFTNTDTEWTTINNLAGWKFKNRSDNTKYIFIPAAGRQGENTLYFKGTNGYLWSAAYRDASLAYFSYFDSSNKGQNKDNRKWGFSIRAIHQ